MRVLVYGAGAVGGYLGAMLANCGNDVTLIVRPDAAEPIRKAGLFISRPNEPSLQLDMEVVTSVRQAFLDDRTYDVILLGMKSYDVEEALNALIAFCPKPYPYLITLQNGIGAEETVIEHCGAERVIAGSLTTPVSRESPEHITVEHSDRGLALAPTQRKQDIDGWVQMFTDAGVLCQKVRHYRSMKWSKALLNMLGNASSAIINRHPKAVYDYKPTYNLEMEMIDEALKVMRSLKLRVVDLPGTPTTRLAKAKRLPEFVVRPILTRIIAEGRGNKMPSFHLDLTAGRKRNEVLYHNGAVAAAGREREIATPVNFALTDILMKMANGQIDYQVFDGNPGRLIEEVNKYRE